MGLTAVTPDPDGQVWVEARANVLGLRWGERAKLGPDTFELGACIERGLVVRVDPATARALELAPPARRGGCGCGN